jgi:hypothetical protein
MAPSLSPEFSLVAACAIWPPSAYRTDAIRAAASEALDWERFLRVVERHAVWGLVHDGLQSARTKMPPNIAREIAGESATLVQQNLAMAAEATQLQRLFEDAGLPLLFLKGTSLAVLAYGNLGLRSAKDIDLLVAPENLDHAINLIQHAGYVRFDPPTHISDAQLPTLMQLRGDLGFLHKANGLQVELHWRLFMNPHAMNDASVWAKSRFVPLAGTNGLWTLGEEDLFTYLCVHGALHVWNRLKWLADVNALLASDPQGSAKRFSRAAIDRGAGVAATQAMLLCHKLFGAPLPASLIQTLRHTLRARWLEATALKAMTLGHGEVDPRDVRFGTTRGSLSTLLLGQSWSYSKVELRNRVFNETDVLAVPLPKQLRFLYPFLRLPMWLWRHTRRAGFK